MKNSSIKETVLITGAASGIGLELAREFAGHRHPLVLVAPVAAEINQVAFELQEEHGIAAIAIAKDLTQPHAAKEIFEQLRRTDTSVGILVNHAGLGQRGHFWEVPLERDLEMIRLNIEAVVRLTKFFLPPMLVQGHGRILNTASVAGFEPEPLLAVYRATKAFVLSLSESLAAELADTEITVTALCLGPVAADFFPTTNLIESPAVQKAPVMAPQAVARMAYAALMKGERVIVPGDVNPALPSTPRLTPESAAAKMNQQLYAETKPNEHPRESGDIEAEAALKEC